MSALHPSKHYFLSDRIPLDLIPELGLAVGKRDGSGGRSGWFAELSGVDGTVESADISFHIDNIFRDVCRCERSIDLEFPRLLPEHPLGRRPGT